MEEKDIQITLPYKLTGKLSKKIKEAGFDTITEYIIFILEQTISSEEVEGEGVYGEEEEKEVKERLKELGYL